MGGTTKNFIFDNITLGNLLRRGMLKMSISSDGKMALAAFPMPFALTNKKAVIALSINNEKSWAAVHSAIKNLLIGFGIIALLSVVIISLSISIITKPLFWLLDFMKELKEGRFIRASEYKASDELGLLHKMANAVMASTGKFCWTVKKDLKSLSSGAKELNHATKYLSDESAYLNEIASSVTHEIEDANSALSSIEEATHLLQDASYKISENVVKTASIANEAQEKASFTTQIIHGLAESSEQIGNIIQVIKGISEQTNLLALNATIEAARAGEAGKGFAVVANEVKELAKQTGNATDEITKMINNIQKDTKASVKAVDEITDVVSQASELSNTVATAIEDQNSTINNIVHNLDLAHDKISSLNTTAHKLYDQAQKLASVSEQIVATHDKVINSTRELDSFVGKYQVDINAIKRAEELSMT